MNMIDKLLNKITMYRLLVYVLGGYAILSLLFALFGKIVFEPSKLIVSLGLVVGASYITDRVLARLFKIPSNMESALLSGLIIFFVVHPAYSALTAAALVLAGAVSSASKFLLTWHGKHLFNPAAFGAAVVSLAGLQATTWWIGSSAFWPVTLVLGLLIVRKIRRFPLVISFALVSVALQAFLFISQHQPLASNIKHALIASPLIFLGTIMLTEPATMPPRRKQQIVFGALVAVLYITAWQIGPFIIYPEVALLLGNVFAFAISPKFRVRMHLQEVQRISDRVYNYVFQPERKLTFIPGQYMEWTLGDVPYDSRGNRRTFTIASSPTEDTVQLGVKFYEPASTYKARLYGLEVGDTVYASQLAGNFTLPKGELPKLVFIAGGIGITPFRSMLKYLTDTATQADVILLYVVSDAQEFAYTRECKAAAQVGVRTIPIVTDPAYQASGVVTAKLDASLIAKFVPDYAERAFYISGPNTMVDATKAHLRALGIARHRIKTDHFSGY